MTVEIFNLNSKFCWFTTSLVTKWATTKTLIPIFPHQPDFDLHHQVLLNQILLHLSSHGLKSHWACSTLHFLKLNLGLRWVQYRYGGLCVPSILWVKHQPNLANCNIICAAFKDPQSELVDPVSDIQKDTDDFTLGRNMMVNQQIYHVVINLTLVDCL